MTRSAIETACYLAPENSANHHVLLATTSEMKARLLQQVLRQAGAKTSLVLPGNNQHALDEKAWETAFRQGPLGRHRHLSSIPPAVAYAKAQHVAELHPGSPIFAADSMKLLNLDPPRILGKPATPEEAVKMLLAQSGQRITQIAGVAYRNPRGWAFGAMETIMRIREVSPEQALAYVRETPDILNAAGGIPITDARALDIFYQDSRFSTVMKYQDGDGNPIEQHGEIVIEDQDLTDLILAVYGFSPSLLKNMGFI